MSDGRRGATEGIPWTRIALWWGVAADALSTVAMCSAGLFVKAMGISLPAEEGLATGLLYGAPLMLGWTLLLFWAALKPLERRGVLLCLLPVIAGCIGLDVLLLLRGILRMPAAAVTLAMKAVLVCLCIVGYADAARKADRASTARPSRAVPG